MPGHEFGPNRLATKPGRAEQLVGMGVGRGHNEASLSKWGIADSAVSLPRFLMRQRVHGSRNGSRRSPDDPPVQQIEDLASRITGSRRLPAPPGRRPRWPAFGGLR